MIDRYTLSKMGDIWSEKHKMEIMLKIEVLACEALCKLGQIPKQAIEKIIKQFPDAHFFVSSDDIEWAKENITGNFPVTFISHPEIIDYEELVLQSLCKHNIIANSTFSWWGAWLNQNPDKIIIAPKKWFLNENTENNLIPTTWIQI